MKISRDDPCYYLTSVTNKRLAVFRTDKFKEITTNPIDEARTSSGILIFAYVIMPDHYQQIAEFQNLSKT